MTRSPFWIFAGSIAVTPFLVLGCGGTQSDEGSPELSSTEAQSAAPTPQPPELIAPAPAPEPPPPPITVTPSERTPIEGTAPTIRIVSPRNGQTIRRGDVMVRLRLRNWELGEAPGNHVHLFIDDEAYIALRDVSSPLNVTELYRNAFGRELPEGTHVLRMFPSRSHHESVKEGAPLATVVFHHRSQTEGFAFDASAPVLTYSRPKGCVVAGEPALLDFYLSNVEELSAEGIRVHYQIGDAEGDLTQWVPHQITNLPVGEVAVHLTLVGPGGPIAGTFNDTTRTIQVAESCE